jgi:hypothetical protein
MRRLAQARNDELPRTDGRNVGLVFSRVQLIQPPFISMRRNSLHELIGAKEKMSWNAAIF